ncbi:unnamed protein product [Rotaria magnacalcarata]|uniref:Uncharacterized protein n=1 Tax=Rotaria magnacalcarata TaxID=392030 RepID=A0A8S2KE25_9BILA|nr:unnamed protein product [Rotaria magnacalcarata]
MVLVRKRRGGRRHKKLKAIDPFYSGPRKLLVDKLEIKFALDRARYESKYDVKLVNTEKGDHQYEVKKEKSHRAEKRLKRLQSKKDDNKLKKEEKKIKDDEFKFFQDKPKFGEIVHEPPTLTLPRRSKLNKDAAGMKDLLLKEKLKNVNSFSGSYRKKDN